MEGLTLIVSLWVALAAWREWYTNKQRLKNELFDRRYAVYEQITGFMASVTIEGKLASNSEVQFIQNTKQAYFIFACDPKIKSLIDEIYKKSVELQALNAELQNLEGESRKNNLSEELKIKSWFSLSLKGIDKEFERFLKLSV